MSGHGPCLNHCELRMPQIARMVCTNLRKAFSAGVLHCRNAIHHHNYLNNARNYSSCLLEVFSHCHKCDTKTKLPLKAVSSCRTAAVGATGDRKMANLNFCANLSMMFTEHESYQERYQAAAAQGFKAVEICFPYDEAVENLKTGATLKTILINTDPGKPGQLGHAAIAGREKEFLESFQKSLKYAEALKVQRLHIMSGCVPEGADRGACYATLEYNLRRVIPELQKRNIVGVIEPINNQTVPGYFLNNYGEALDLVKRIDSPFVRLQLDIFHLQHIQGNLTKFLREAIDYIGHIQIAQVPLRNEPSTPGEINYPYVLGLLAKELQYKHWIGLEYKPLNGTVNGLEWVNQLGYNLQSHTDC